MYIYTICSSKNNLDDAKVTEFSNEKLMWLVIEFLYKKNNNWALTG